ncbi:MAG TPA: hypothetical protein VFG74_06705 [Miltoncostaeaceae bacterium]|nr:hypothetical protein [Miltoncostaeaceae bacterium]
MSTAAAPEVAASAAATAEITVTLADSVADIDRALAVLHDGYVEAGYLTPRPSGRRMHPAYLNPGTVFILAHMEGDVVGTCAIVADGPFGLPSDRAFQEENDALRAAGGLCECGSLTVSRRHRRHTRRIVMRMFATASRVARDEFSDANVVIAVTPENERFYRGIAAAEPLAEPRPLYGAPASLMRTTGRRIAEHSAGRATPTQRLMDTMMAARDPEWLLDERTNEALPPAWIASLFEESGATDRLLSQLALLTGRDPARLARAVGLAARSEAA